MRCNICDKALTEKEIQWNPDLMAFDPCTICLDIALDAAYGQHRPDDEGIALLDADFDEVDGLSSWINYGPIYSETDIEW